MGEKVQQNSAVQATGDKSSVKRTEKSSAKKITFDFKKSFLEKDLEMGGKNIYSVAECYEYFNGRYSKEEINKYSVLDGDKLTLGAFRKLCYDKRKEEFENAFKEANTNGDEFIDKKEFLSYFGYTYTEDDFKKYAADGKISKDKLKELLIPDQYMYEKIKEINAITYSDESEKYQDIKELLNKIFLDIDTRYVKRIDRSTIPCDGRISFAEFQEYFGHVYSVDEFNEYAGDDGFMNREELEKLLVPDYYKETHKVSYKFNKAVNATKEFLNDSLNSAKKTVYSWFSPKETEKNKNLALNEQ